MSRDGQREFFSNIARQHMVGVGHYDGPFEISLPDFTNSLTRMVYEGIAHSCSEVPRVPFRDIRIGVTKRTVTARLPYAHHA